VGASKENGFNQVNITLLPSNDSPLYDDYLDDGVQLFHHS